MTATGSCSAIPVSRSTGSEPPDRSTSSSTSRPASSSTHGRSRSTWPRANAVLISRRSRVWSGGSISRIALRWMRLKLPNRSAGVLVRPDPAQPPVAQDGVGLGVGERQPQAQALVPLHRRDRAGPRERRVGIGDDGGVGEVERDGGHGHAGEPRPDAGPLAPPTRRFDGEAPATAPPTLRAWLPASAPPPPPPTPGGRQPEGARARAAPAAGTSTATARATPRR